MNYGKGTRLPNGRVSPCAPRFARPNKKTKGPPNFNSHCWRTAKNKYKKEKRKRFIFPVGERSRVKAGATNFSEEAKKTAKTRVPDCVERDSGMNGNKKRAEQIYWTLQTFANRWCFHFRLNFYQFFPRIKNGWNSIQMFNSTDSMCVCGCVCVYVRVCTEVRTDLGTCV